MAKFLDQNGLLYLWQKIKTMLDGKVDKADGKGLSTNDFTTTEKNKLAGIEAGAQKNTVTGVKGSAESEFRTGQIEITPANVGLGNVQNVRQMRGLASGTTEDHVVVFGVDGFTPKDSGFTLGKSVPADAKFTDTTYDVATESKAGLMSATDKKNLDEMVAGAGQIVVDSALSESSTNPVQNKVLTAEINKKMSTVEANETFAKKSDITAMYKFKGAVGTKNELPTGATVGDVYNVTDTDKNYAWTGTEWDDLGGSFSVETITNGDIDGILAS